MLWAATKSGAYGVTRFVELASAVAVYGLRLGANAILISSSAPSRKRNSVLGPLGGYSVGRWELQLNFGLRAS